MVARGRLLSMFRAGRRGAEQSLQELGVGIGRVCVAFHAAASRCLSVSCSAFELAAGLVMCVRRNVGAG